MCVCVLVNFGYVFHFLVFQDSENLPNLEESSQPGPRTVALYTSSEHSRLHTYTTLAEHFPLWARFFKVLPLPSALQ